MTHDVSAGAAQADAALLLVLAISYPLLAWLAPHLLALAPLGALWDAGSVAFLPGIGFPDPDRSHFVSLDRWWRADELSSPTGWLGHGVADADDVVEAELAAFGLTDRADALPRNLSSGQRRRLALAAAFVRPSRLLVLDEPERRLDTAMRDRLAERLAAARVDVLAVGPDDGLPVATDGVDEMLMPILEILPLQQLAWRLAIDRGGDPDRPRGLSKVTETW